MRCKIMSIHLKSALLYGLAMTVVAATYAAQSIIIPFQAAVALAAVFISAFLGFVIGPQYLTGRARHLILKLLIYPLLLAFLAIFIAAFLCAVSYPLWGHLIPRIGDLPDIGSWVFSSSLMISLSFLQDLSPPTLPLFLVAAALLLRISRPAPNNSFKPRPLRGSA